MLSGKTRSGNALTIYEDVGCAESRNLAAMVSSPDQRIESNQKRQVSVLARLDNPIMHDIVDDRAVSRHNRNNYPFLVGISFSSS